jgi:hypothetical protein
MTMFMVRRSLEPERVDRDVIEIAGQRKPSGQGVGQNEKHCEPCHAHKRREQQRIPRRDAPGRKRPHRRPRHQTVDIAVEEAVERPGRSGGQRSSAERRER